MKYRGFPNIQAGLDDPLVASKLGFAKSLVGIAQKIQGTTKKAFVRLKREVDSVVVEVLVFHNQSIIRMSRLGDGKVYEFVFTSLVWMPEGFYLWPKNDDVPKGWGLPFVDGELLSINTDDGPTENGALPFVLVNKKQHNNYPDKLIEGSHSARPLFYMPSQHAGIGRTKQREVTDARGAKTVSADTLPQFTGRRWEQALYEPDGETWHAHWPELVKLSEKELGILDATNKLRTLAGVPAMMPALRGLYKGAAGAIIGQMARTRVQAHNYEGYAEGYQLFIDRFLHRYGTVFTTAAQEIIVTVSDLTEEEEAENGGPETPYETGERMVEVWETSPTHNAAMIFDGYHNNVPGALETVGFTQIATGRGTTEKYEASPGVIEDVEPPAVGTYGAQVLYGTDLWLAAGNAYWRGSTGTVSWRAASSCRYGLVPFDAIKPGASWNTWASRRNILFIKGRIFPVYVLGVESPTVRAVVSAAFCEVLLDEDGATDLRLRVCTVNGSHLLQIWDGPAGASWSAFSVMASFDPTTEVDEAEGAMLLGYPIFSSSGAKCVVTLTRRMFHTGPALRGGQINFNVTDGTAMVAGSVIDFLEFAQEDDGSASFGQVHRSRLDFVPTTALTTVLDEETHEKKNEYVETCLGEYRWLADYEGDALVYATVALDIAIEQEATYRYAYDFMLNDLFPPVSSEFSSSITFPSVLDQTSFLRFHQTLTFPGGDELVTGDATITDWVASGTLLNIHTLDIRHPDKTAYSRLAIGNVDVAGEDLRPSASSVLVWNGGELKPLVECFGAATGEAMPKPIVWRGCSWGGGITRPTPWSIFNIVGSTAKFRSYAHPKGVATTNIRQPSAANGDLPAQGAGDRVRDAHPANISSYFTLDREFSHRVTDGTDSLGPMMDFAIFDYEVDSYPVNLGMWEYNGEWVLSGRYASPAREEDVGFYEPESEQYLWRATFDLAAAVGKPLGNNIEPVGVV